MAFSGSGRLHGSTTYVSGYIGAGNLSLNALNYKKAQLMVILMKLIKQKIT